MSSYDYTQYVKHLRSSIDREAQKNARGAISRRRLRKKAGAAGKLFAALGAITIGTAAVVGIARARPTKK